MSTVVKNPNLDLYPTSLKLRSVVLLLTDNDMPKFRNIGFANKLLDV
jgi:hypothetical protein